MFRHRAPRHPPPRPCHGHAPLWQGQDGLGRQVALPLAPEPNHVWPPPSPTVYSVLGGGCQPLPKALGLPTVEAGDAIHFQGRWAFPPWPVVDAQGPHCERRPKAKRNHSANSTGRSRLPLDGKGRPSHTEGCYFETMPCGEVLRTTMLERGSAPHLHGTDFRNIQRPARYDDLF